MSQIVGRLEVCAGCVTSGKTQELLRRLNIIADAECKVSILFVNSALDSRSDQAFSTHGHAATLNKNITCVKVNKLGECFDMAKKYDVVGIDEGQFFDDIVPFTMELLDLNKYIIIASLDSNFNRKPFGHVLELFQHANRIDKFYAMCTNCAKKGIMEPALYSKKIVMEAIKDEFAPSIGGQEKYVAVCRSCFGFDKVNQIIEPTQQLSQPSIH